MERLLGTRHDWWKGFKQTCVSNFFDVFSLVVRIETIRPLLAIQSQFKDKVHQLHVQSAFLNGEIQEDIFVLKPNGFEVRESKHMVYKLNKAPYGLK